MTLYAENAINKNVGASSVEKKPGVALLQKGRFVKAPAAMLSVAGFMHFLLI